MFAPVVRNLCGVAIILLTGSNILTRRLVMKIKFFIGFAILGLSLASAKSYEISVDTVSKAGEVQLQPGAYKVTFDGAKVKFTDENSGKSVETNATIETNGKAKFDARSEERRVGKECRSR